MTIRNGNGGSNTLMDATTSTLTGGLTVISAAGDDLFSTTGTLFTVGTVAARRNLTISNGTGEGGTQQDFSATTNTINGSLSVAATAGFDLFDVNGDNFNVLGSVRVSAGTGGSITVIDPNLIVNIDGAVIVTATEGKDLLAFNGATSVDLLSVTFSSGNGASDLDFNGAKTTATGTIRHASAVGGTNTNFNAAITDVKAITSTHTDGFDTFDVNGGTSFTSGAITIRNGNGGSDTFIDNTGTNTVTGAISIVNGDGFDTFQTGGTGFTLGSGATGLLRRNLTINHGTGGSGTGFTAWTDTINGAISVVNGSGSGIFNVESGTLFTVTGVTGNVTINNGAGGNNTFIDGATNNQIGGRLTIIGTDGRDVVVLQRLTVAGATTITTGNGDDHIQTESSAFTGLFRVTAGAGADQVLIEALSVNFTDDLRCTFGAANINLGNGDDILEIGTDNNDGADFAAAVTLAGGLDLDRFINVLASVNTGLPVFPPLPPFLGFEQFS